MSNPAMSDEILDILFDKDDPLLRDIDCYMGDDLTGNFEQLHNSLYQPEESLSIIQTLECLLKIKDYELGKPSEKSRNRHKFHYSEKLVTPKCHIKFWRT
ncbi:hypothetical protein AVEN_252091-1 [Araneus ventricosus]|uniref:Uncharacterized protein n=1 Tax=Araneus ventricosus TaxID=182803 RepID=A0A4Y2WY51_ARAVE|nr:hypothetical protein AVEN_252091-1 [Araneus ventricosus]